MKNVNIMSELLIARECVCVQVFFVMFLTCSGHACVSFSRSHLFVSSNFMHFLGLYACSSMQHTEKMCNRLLVVGDGVSVSPWRETIDKIKACLL